MNRPHEQVGRREFLKRTTRATVAVAVSGAMASAAVPLAARAGEAGSPLASRICYYRDGEIHVSEIGKPEGKPVTTGHSDFKPSWSKTGDMLVCFRRLKDDPANTKWKNAIFVINVDGTGYHTLSDGTRTDVNPTWTRDGKNTPIWNRLNDKTGHFFVMQSKVGGKPGEEVAITDESVPTWAHSCLRDGRILVTSLHPTLGGGAFLVTRKADGKPHYELIQCEPRDLVTKGVIHRASISPSEKKICFEYMAGAGLYFIETGHTLYLADFDADKRTITNLKAIANATAKPNPFWYAYPRWIDGESAVVYHVNKNYHQNGKGQLHVYRLEDGSTKLISTNADADYRYPNGEAAPC